MVGLLRKFGCRFCVEMQPLQLSWHIKYDLFPYQHSHQDGILFRADEPKYFLGSLFRHRIFLHQGADRLSLCHFWSCLLLFCVPFFSTPQYSKFWPLVPLWPLAPPWPLVPLWPLALLWLLALPWPLALLRFFRVPWWLV